MNGCRAIGGKVGYKSIPKTASTSIKRELYRLHTGKPFDRQEAGMTSHQFFNQTENTDIDNCEYKFIVIRDPVKRLLSVYGNRVTFYHELSYDQLNSNDKTRKFINRLPVLEPSLDQFIANLPKYFQVPAINHHARPVSKMLAGKSLRFFDGVYKIEELGELEKDLSALLSKPVSFERHQTGGSKYRLRDLSYAQLKYLINFYEEDYKLLRLYYSPEALWNEWYAGARTMNKVEFNSRSFIFKLRTRLAFNK